MISSLLLIITPDILKYYQKYKVCAVPQKTVHAEHREMLQKIKDKDKDGMKELVLRHLSNLIDFAKLSTKGEIPEFEYGHSNKKIIEEDICPPLLFFKLTASLSIKLPDRELLRDYRPNFRHRQNQSHHSLHLLPQRPMVHILRYSSYPTSFLTDFPG